MNATPFSGVTTPRLQLMQSLTIGLGYHYLMEPERPIWDIEDHQRRLNRTSTGPLVTARKAAWEHLLLYGYLDREKSVPAWSPEDAHGFAEGYRHMGAIDADDPYYKWLNREMGDPTASFLRYAQEGGHGAEELVRKAHETIALEKERTIRKRDLARFCCKYPDDVRAALDEIDRVLFDGTLAKHYANGHDWRSPLLPERDLFQLREEISEGELKSYFDAYQAQLELRIWQAVEHAVGPDFVAHLKPQMKVEDIAPERLFPESVYRQNTDIVC